MTTAYPIRLSRFLDWCGNRMRNETRMAEAEHLPGGPGRGKKKQGFLPCPKPSPKITPASSGEDQSQTSPGLRGHGDSQTEVFLLPKLRPAIFTIKKFCAMTLILTSASPLK